MVRRPQTHRKEVLLAVAAQNFASSSTEYAGTGYLGPLLH